MFSQEMLKELSPPSLLLDLDALDRNCQRIANKANGKKIRIATKSIRSVPILKRILQSHSVYEGVMCYSSQEALFLAKQGFNDILLGYPVWDELTLYEIAKLDTKKYSLMTMVDSIEHLRHLEKIAHQAKGSFRVCMDIDMSTSFGSLHFGVRRSPIRHAQDALKLAQSIAQSDVLELVGIMGYEAQIAGVGDQVPSQGIKNTLITFLKNKSLKEIKTRRQRVIEGLRKEGFSLSLVNGGGTGSMHTTTLESDITEITVGSGFYAPHLFDYYHAFRYEPALYFALPIVRKPAPHIFTCAGGGYIASGSIGEDKAPKPVYPHGGKLLPLEGAGEVQTPVYFEKEELKIGDSILFRAAKAGEICERFTKIICFSEGEIVDEYKTYRGEGVCFL